MEVTNTTNEDAKYKVTGGSQGSGMNPHKPFDVEEATGWPTIPPGGRVEHKPKSPGPWTVYFLVKDQGFFKKVHSDTERVTLVAAGGGFRVDSN